MHIIPRIICAALSLAPLAVCGADYHWLTFKMTDNSELSVAAEGLSLTYSAGQLKLSSPIVDQSIATAQIASMRFSSNSAGAVEGVVDRDGEAEYFALTGVSLGRFASIDEARQKLPSGTYIAKNSSHSFKVIF